MIAFHSPESGQVIDSFYGKCLHYNRPRARAAFPGRRSGSAGDRGGAAGIDRPSNLGNPVAVGEHSGRESGRESNGMSPEAAGEVPAVAEGGAGGDASELVPAGSSASDEASAETPKRMAAVLLHSSRGSAWTQWRSVPTFSPREKVPRKGG